MLNRKEKDKMRSDGFGGWATHLKGGILRNEIFVCDLKFFEKI